MLKHLYCAALFLISSGASVFAVASAGGGPSLYVSTSPDRTNASLLDGTTPNGDVYIFVDTTEVFRSVSFYVDGGVVQSSRNGSYDFAGTNTDGSAKPFNISSLSTGSHQISVNLMSPGITKVVANISVAGDLNPPLPLQLLFSRVSNRTQPEVLSDSVVTGEVYIFVEYSFEIDRVDFYLDGVSVGADEDAPFDFSGGSRIQATPLNLNGLPQGPHQISAKVTLRNGTQFDVDSSFTTYIVDTQPPTINSIWSAPANENGWNNTVVTVAPECVDLESGVATCAGGASFELEGAGQNALFTASDLAGNTATLDLTVNIDLTNPEQSVALSTESNTAGWHKAPVTVEALCSDALSGVAICPEKIEVIQDGVHQLQLSATDNADNLTVVPVTVQLDTTPPDIVAQPSIASMPSGWFNQPVTFSFNCTDGLSGVLSCPNPIVFDEPGRRQIASVSVSDVAGNVRVLDLQVDLDFNAPVVRFLSHSDNLFISNLRPVFRLSISDLIAIDPASVSLKWGMTDAICQPSGAEFHCQFSSGFTSTAPVIVEARALDLAGNESITTISLIVDSDADQVADFDDVCPNSALGEPVNAEGCDAYQRDTDGDGFTDAEEQAAGTDVDNPLDQPVLKIVSFSAIPEVVNATGASVQLVWQTQGAHIIELHNDVGTPSIEGLSSSGSVSLSPTITTHYTLVAKSEASQESQTLVVGVEVPSEPSLWQSPAELPIPQDKIASSLSVAADGSSYLGSFDGNFYKLDASGKLVWTFESAGLIKGKALFAGELIVVGANVGSLTSDKGKGRIYAMDSGMNSLWQFETPSAVIASPILSTDGKTVFVASYSGEIFALNTADGQSIWRYQLPGGQRIVAAPVFVTEQAALIVHSASGNLYGLSTTATSPESRLLWSRVLAE